MTVKKLNYTHDAMIDAVIRQPGIKQFELAALFGYTPAWVCNVMSSDSWKEALAKRKGEIVDPTLMMEMEEKLRAACDKSLEVIIERLEETKNANQAIRALDITTRALGYGAKPAGPVVHVGTQYVAVVPAVSRNSKEWVEQHTPVTIQDIVPVTVEQRE